MLLKKAQDESLPVQSHYIRRMIHLTNVPVYEEDNPVPVTADGASSNVYIVICMTDKGSWRLHETQYIQSDMAFKRVVMTSTINVDCNSQCSSLNPELVRNQVDCSSV
jgi:hypothetical protein